MIAESLVVIVVVVIDVHTINIRLESFVDEEEDHVDRSRAGAGHCKTWNSLVE